MDYFSLKEDDPNLYKEYKRFIELKVACEDFYSPFKLYPSVIVNRIWSAHVLETESYLEMCKRYGATINYSRSDTEGKREKYAHTLKSYEKMFSTPSKKYWPTDQYENLKENGTISITIVSLNGAVYKFQVLKSATTNEITKLIQIEAGIPPDQQRLIFNGGQMDIGRSLSDYKVCNGSKIYLTGRIRGC